MDQNEQKSVWLKLLLPICLGVFATAIYHNAIKTQKVSAQGYTALKNIELGTQIDTEQDWNKLFEATTLVFHKETPQSIKDSYGIKEVAFPLKVGVELAKGDMISQASFSK
ncbi:hypothetical protein N9Y42_03100 [Mariniblastus sp.]|nr:hypothetical protein [Mariniblastus sp.]